MKVVLLKDVKGMGRAHESVEAKDGYALNFLIPKKLAIPATSAALKEAELRLRQTKERKEVDAKVLAGNIAALAEARIVVRAKANEKGHLYDAVGAREIAQAAKAEAHIDIPENALAIEKPFKEIGTFRVPVSSGETFGEFPITIEAE
ncbi:MAG TPA: 50S ribosomal protein L9 [Candidatus Paceibacterota bacterium]|nr:50S ribosomal protein L9 [Candidatus Paceibacterota bacterium]